MVNFFRLEEVVAAVGFRWYIALSRPEDLPSSHKKRTPKGDLEDESFVALKNGRYRKGELEKTPNHVVCGKRGLTKPCCGMLFHFLVPKGHAWFLCVPRA